MPQTGSLIVRAYVSRAQLPVQDATVIIYVNAPNDRHQLLSIKTTNESGIAGPITLPTSDSLGLSPNSPAPFTSYQLIVEHPGYQLALFNDLQVFPGVETVQDVPLIPLSVPESPDRNSTTVTPQPL